MVSLLVSIAALILGYFIYGKFIEKVMGANAALPTPARTKTDNVDFIPLRSRKAFMIQFLNIAGTGPVFGALMGAQFGTSCLLWIVLGCIFAGAVHDYFSGMLSVRHDGVGLPDIVGHFLGNRARRGMLVLSTFMLLLVGAVFVYSPAAILGSIEGSPSIMFWICIVLAYYIIATLVPIDKIIGKIYPVFAACILFMAVAMFIALIVKWPSQTPEIWNGLQNRHPDGLSIFPYLFVTVACGAISGFHATQSPLMARCLKNEKMGRPVFFGAMIAEGIVTLIWATVGAYFFYGGGAEAMGVAGMTDPPLIVKTVAMNWLGVAGGLLTLIGVVAAPITTGDTALRSARLIIADALKLDQSPIRNRLAVSIPIFIAAGFLLWLNIAANESFNVIWRYLGWANQGLSIFTLLAISVWLLKRKGKNYFLITLIPASFMTSVCTSFICNAKIGFNIPQIPSTIIGMAAAAATLILFLIYKRKYELQSLL